MSNNWEGVKTFFNAFGSSFMEGIGRANRPLGTLVGYLQSAFNFLGQLLGPLDQTSAKWRSWDEAVGGAAASGVNAIVSAIQRLIGFFESAISGAVGLGSAVKNMLGFGGGASAAPMATPVPTCRQARWSGFIRQALPCRRAWT